ncbi:response regulator transcription factor [Alkalimarinus alittae]|uniref:Response regulator transcription factor n=1 Tax=Alkalimarinus alittae TaxID=2961619 RepID=A0ABY6N3I1_9ALTE|nr:response regulator transcription factor [Alkalimarinus alittae]UZE96665.1 response regulator transcription factor [Alkalimarinus alittae]
MNSPHLLLVEDDSEISELLVTLLSKEGFNITCAFDGNDGLDKAQLQTFDLLILDIMLPGRDGLEVLRELRKSKNTPVLMLTARGDDIDRIVGFEMGADDYLPKPFNPRELIARIKAILRRVGLDHEASKHDTPASLTTQDIEVKPQSRQVFLNSKEVELTNAEYNILVELLSHQGEVIDKAALTQRALGRKLTLYDRAIDMHVSNLRKKLGDTPEGQPRIKTIRGVGYLFQVTEKVSR